MTTEVVSWRGQAIKDMTDEELVDLIDELQTGIFELHDPEKHHFGREHLLAAINELAEVFDGFYESSMVRECAGERIHINGGG